MKTVRIDCLLRGGQGTPVALYAALDDEVLAAVLDALGPDRPPMGALTFTATMAPDGPDPQRYSVRAWRVRSLTELDSGKVLYERRPRPNWRAGWYHTDGTECPVSVLPEGSPDGQYWCTEHQQHLYSAAPAALVHYDRAAYSPVGTPGRRDLPDALNLPLATADLHAVLAGQVIRIDVPAGEDGGHALVVFVRPKHDSGGQP